VSQRRACRVAGQHRATQRRQPPVCPGEEARLRARLRRPVRTDKRRRVAASVTERLRAERPNQVWAIDFQFDQTSDGRRLKLANIVDEHTREALAMRVDRTCTADDLVEALAGLVAGRGAPEHLRMDNGPELLAWALRDWCRLLQTRTNYIEPGSPWENPYVESFNGRVRDELLNLEEFTSLTVAQVVVEAWRIEYNTYRPHSALGGLSRPDPQLQVIPHGIPRVPACGAPEVGSRVKVRGELGSWLARYRIRSPVQTVAPAAPSASRSA
jgi:putative transposase